MSREEFFAAVAARLRPHAPLPDNPAALLDELGWDSLQMYELLLVVEELIGAEVTDEDLPRLNSMEGVYDYYGALRAPRESA